MLFRSEDVPVATLRQVLLYHVITAEIPAAQVSTGYATTPTDNQLSLYIEKSSGVKINGDVNVTEADLLATNGVIHIVDKVIGLPTVVSTALTNPNFSTLVSALTRADLVSALSGAGPFTVFAPTNEAFSAFLSANGFASLEEVPVPVLTQVLLNHVVATRANSSGLSTQYVNSLATFGNTTSNLSLFIEKDDAVTVNGSNVIIADVNATNGVIHAVDKVIGLPTVVNHALNNPEFSTLVAALTRPDLGVDYVSILSGAGPFTVFAPTNAAFSALLTELGAPNLAAIPASTLNSVLQYHVVANANVRAGQLIDEQVVGTFQGTSFTIDLTGGAKIRDGQNRIANIIATDVQGVNGVVHAIDKVILPDRKSVV